mgnify:CR=1 FL=1
MEDSSAKDTSESGNGLTPQQKLARLVVAVTTPLIDKRISTTEQGLSRQFTRLISKLDDLSGQVSTLRTENTELRKESAELKEETGELRENLLKLHAEYNEVRNYAQSASDSAASAKADNRYLNRTMERTNLLSDIVVTLVDTLIEPFYEWAGMIIKKRYELDPRKPEESSLTHSRTFIDRRKR